MPKIIRSLLAWSVLAMVPALAAPRPIILATTTSTQDSGLLDVLIPMFQRQTGIMVKTIAVGSGQALAMGAKGEADVLLSHSPDAEKKFMADGHGSRRRLVMHNDFVVLGPPADPADIRAARTAPEAFRRLAAQGRTWVARADNSGTDAEEQKIWKAAGLDPRGQKWYLQTGLGMGQTLNVAAEKRGYTLSDRGTYLAMQKSLGMAILCQGDPSLLNIYHVIEVDPAKFPKVNGPGGTAFAEFMLAPATQETIRSFGVQKYGSPLFFPDAGKRED
jgi:tungstate transport system substrate-binding protein